MTQAASGVAGSSDFRFPGHSLIAGFTAARCAVNVPSDLVPLLEKIKTAEGMTRP